MKTWKLVSGILCMVAFIFILFQSCAAGIVNTIEDNGDISGSVGLIVSIMMLTGGIVSVATRNSTGKGANIALIVIFGLAALLGVTSTGVYKDLAVWGAWCLICAVLALVALIQGNKKAKTNVKSTSEGIK